jgi:hypothetical protein
MPLAPWAAGTRRLTALLLLAVFLGAGTTLPGADALLFHWDATGGEQSGTHVEAAGGCASHLERCALGRAAVGGTALLAAAPVVRVQPEAAGAEPRRPVPPPTSHDRGTLPQPRAPPVAVA